MPEWEVQYHNWLLNDSLEDTSERKEAFQAGWKWCHEIMQEKFRKL
jgi:hypothetical protein